MGNKGRLYLAEPPLFQNSPLDCFEIHPLSERLRLFRFSLKAVKSDQRRCLWTPAGNTVPCTPNIALLIKT